MSRYHRNSTVSRARRGGQAIVEFALVVTILLTLLLGLIQFSLLYNTSITLTTIARDTARYAAIHGTENTTLFNGSFIATDTAIRNYAREVAENTLVLPTHLPDNRITITPPRGDSQRASGRPITVTISYDMTRKIIVGRSFPGISALSTTYPVTATMIIE